MADAFAPEDLWAKAKLFVNRSGRAASADDFPEAALWAGLALELLGKAALANVNPALIADPADDGKSLLVAARAVPSAGDFRSIPAKAIFSRCARAFSPFDAREALIIAGQRNAELHSGETPFLSLKEEVWWPRYWSLVMILLQAQDRELEEFVGPARVAEVEAHLVRNKQIVRDRVSAAIARAEQRFALLASDVVPRSVQDRIASALEYTTEFFHRTAYGCPACKLSAFLCGDEIIERETISEFNDDEQTVDNYDECVVAADYIGCGNCGLRLEGYDLLTEAGIDTGFTVYEEPTFDYEEDYANE
jgi:hypothetical protein